MSIALWFYLLFHHRARQQSASLVFCSCPPWFATDQMGSHYHPKTTWVTFTPYTCLCSSAFSHKMPWTAEFEVLLHKEKSTLTQTPKPPLSPALAFALRVVLHPQMPQHRGTCKVRGSSLQESSHHSEGNTDRQNARALVQKRSFWNSNRMSGHWKWVLKLREMADL